MEKVNSDPQYSPTSFVTANLALLLPGNDLEVTSVDFSGILKKPFQSGNRPVGTINITCRNDNEKYFKRKIFLKFHNNAGYAFDMMQQIYHTLAYRELHRNMPAPLGCDRENGVYYQEFVEGIGLKYRVALRLSMNRRREINETSGLMFDIGNWLSGYHKALDLNEKLNFGDLIRNLMPVIDQENHFFTGQENIWLIKLLKDFESDYRHFTLNLTRPHNDFSLRNIIVVNDQDFKVIDWDAMVQKDFPDKAPVWNDIVCFYLNLHSLVRFYPLVRPGNIEKLSRSFINGYFNSEQVLNGNDIKKFIWFFSLCYYIGLIGDRALPLIYRTRLNRRFIRKLHKSLLSGAVDMAKI